MNVFVWHRAMQHESEVRVNLSDEDLTALAAGEIVSERFPSEGVVVSVLMEYDIQEVAE